MTKSRLSQASKAGNTRMSVIGAKSSPGASQTAKRGIQRRDYISWSALNLLEHDEAGYVRRYIHGEAGFTNDAMDFGKVVADALQDETSTDTAIRYLITFIPKFDVPELEITATYKKIKLLGRPDTIRGNLSEFREYKTGRTPWTQRKVDSHGQLIFYATIIFLKTRKIPKAYLDWVPTEYHVDEWGIRRIELTGEIKSFTRAEITLSDVTQMLKRIEAASKRINTLWRTTKQGTAAR